MPSDSGMRFRQHAQRHQGHGWSAGWLFSELADFRAQGVNRHRPDRKHRAFGGVNHRRRFTHAGAIEHPGAAVARVPAARQSGWSAGLNILRNIHSIPPRRG